MRDFVETGFDVSPRKSIFDFRGHLGAYLLAWIPFILLVVVGCMLRRIRSEVPHWEQTR